MTYESAWSLPVPARKWWIRRTQKQLDMEAKEQEAAQKRGRK